VRRRRVAAESLLPRTGRGCLAVLGGTIFEKIRVLDRVQHLVEPGQRVLGHVKQLAQSQFDQAPVGDKANVLPDFARREAFDRALLKGKVDEGVLMRYDRRACQVDFAPQFLGPKLGIFLDEGAEQFAGNSAGSQTRRKAADPR
jgi:hypothetical protein